MTSETAPIPQAGAPATIPNSEGNPVPQASVAATKPDSESETPQARSPPLVGVSAIILNKEGKVLVGKRINSHDPETWQFPGGKLEFGEGLLQCGVREAWEETKLKVEGIKIVALTNDVFVDAGKHFVTPFALCKMEDADAVPVLMEKEKCEGWGWWDWETLFAGRDVALIPNGSKIQSKISDENDTDKAPLFLPLKNLFLQFKDVAEFKKILE